MILTVYPVITRRRLRASTFFVNNSSRNGSAQSQHQSLSCTRTTNLYSFFYININYLIFIEEKLNLSSDFADEFHQASISTSADKQISWVIENLCKITKILDIFSLWIQQYNGIEIPRSQLKQSCPQFWILIVTQAIRIMVKILKKYKQEYSYLRFVGVGV